MKGMSKEEKGMYIMGSLGEHSKKRTKRGKKNCIDGKRLCFLVKRFARKRSCKQLLQNITTHMNRHSVAPRKHENTGKKPSHSLKFQDISLVVQFISSFANDF
jgi:hypothetical protein